jgi:hypothetical protein
MKPVLRRRESSIPIIPTYGQMRKCSLNVWAGIVGGRLIGPFILHPRLNGTEYLQFLNNTLEDLLEDVTLDVRSMDK